MSIKQHFWRSAGFSAALGVIGKGLALAYGEMTGNAIDADQVALIVEQSTSLVFGAATSIWALIGIWQGVKSAIAKTRALFAPKTEPLPWLKDKQPPQ